ncbi:MAG TPA: polysaccharide deacetylase family protein [Thermoleophilaceae bacterium]|nr:polysaccharide deacetylase family protein [Thermoleophilaceae bacterium]
MGRTPLTKRERAASFLERTRAGALLRGVGAWHGLLVLAYHRIGDGSASALDRALWSATPDELDAQVRLLQRSADLIGPSDIRGALSSRGRHVLLTFDDGYRDNFEQAMPVLSARGAPAVFFLATGFLDQPTMPWWDEVAWMVRGSDRTGLPGGIANGALPFHDASREEAVAALLARYKLLPGSETEAFLDRVAEATGSGRCPASEAEGMWMTWDMARAMRDAGMAFGAHTQTHPVLARLSRDEQAGEIDTCARRLREELDVGMELFSYPVGLRDSFDGVTRSLLEERGVEYAFSCYGGRPARQGWDALDIPRTTVGAGTRHDVFAATVTIPRLFALD